MKQRLRIYYTDSQKALMWERWRKGESLQQIAQLFDRNHSSVQGILAETGGGFNRSMQHTRRCVCSGGVANETAAQDLLHRDSKGPDVGAVAQG
ncbi:hypothetical protein [Burkholderia cepacia]|uniref:hypothetical protein n=1 Tax=Burkholderia cepacia TaxID=292 RepID=UPI0039BF9027